MTSLDNGARNKELVRTFHRRLWAERDLGVIEEMVVSDAKAHWGDSESNAVTAIRADVERYLDAFTEVHTSIDDLIGEDDKVVLRWNTTGTHTPAPMDRGRRVPARRWPHRRGLEHVGCPRGLPAARPRRPGGRPLSIRGPSADSARAANASTERGLSSCHAARLQLRDVASTGRPFCKRIRRYR
jgi:hypothetical protein